MTKSAELVKEMKETLSGMKKEELEELTQCSKDVMKVVKAAVEVAEEQEFNALTYLTGGIGVVLTFLSHPDALDQIEYVRKMIDNFEQDHLALMEEES